MYLAVAETTALTAASSVRLKCFVDCQQLFQQRFELLQVKRICAVRLCMGGIVVDF